MLHSRESQHTTTTREVVCNCVVAPLSHLVQKDFSFFELFFKPLRVKLFCAHAQSDDAYGCECFVV